MAVDPFSMLEHDHRHVERLLEQLGESEEGTARDAMVDQLEHALTVHMAFEEAEVYPLVPRAMDQESADEAQVEHQLARDGLAKVRELKDAPGFGAAVDMVKGGIGHHVEEEEGEMFPALRRQVATKDAERMVDALLAAKARAGLPPLDLDFATKAELYEVARRAGADVSSTMTKDQLRNALGESS